MIKTNSKEAKPLPHFVESERVLLASLSSLLNGKVSEATQKEYDSRLRRIKQAGGKLELVGVGKKEMAVWKAAIKYGARERLRIAGAKAVEILKSTTFESDGLKWKQFSLAMKQVKIAKFNLEKVEAELKEVRGCSKADEVPKESAHKKSAFKSGEAKAFFDALGPSQYRLQMIAALFCGARPQEFESGVTVQFGKVKNDGWVMYLKIHDRAKQSHGTGQKSTSITIPLSGVTDPEYRSLFMELGKAAYGASADGSMLLQVSPTKTQTVGRLLSSLASKVGSKLKSRPSFYSLRHTFASNVKAAIREKHGSDFTASSVEIAMALGHRSTETQRHYARVKRSRGGFSPSAAGSSGYKPRHYGRGAGPKEVVKIQQVAKTLKTSPKNPRPTSL